MVESKMKESELRSRVEVLGKKSSAVERSKVATAAEHRAELAEVNKKLQEWMLKAQRGTQTHLASHSDVIGDSEGKLGAASVPLDVKGLMRLCFERF